MEECRWESTHSCVDAEDSRTPAKSLNLRRTWSDPGIAVEAEWSESQQEENFGRDELVQMEDYYYEEEEGKVLSFKNCSLRIHGIILLILIYAAGYLAYTFAGPPSRRRCK